MKLSLEILEGARAAEVLRLASPGETDDERGVTASIEQRVFETSWGRTACRVIGLVDEAGGLVAALTLRELAFRLDHRKLRLGGLGKPWIREDQRDALLDRYVLVRVEEHLREEELDGALLFTDVGVKALARMGWIELAQRALVADVRGWRDAPRVGASASELRPYEPADFESIRELWSLGSSLQRFTILRNDDFWQAQILRAQLVEESHGSWLGPWSFLVGVRDGRVVSYLRCSRSGPRAPLTVLEYAHEPGAREDITAMLGLIMEKQGEDAPRVIVAVAPSRIENLVPSERMSWRRETDARLIVRAFESFEPPMDLIPDERLVWPTDRF